MRFNLKHFLAACALALGLMLVTPTSALAYPGEGSQCYASAIISAGNLAAGDYLAFHDAGEDPGGVYAAAYNEGSNVMMNIIGTDCMSILPINAWELEFALQPIFWYGGYSPAEIFNIIQDAVYQLLA